MSNLDKWNRKDASAENTISKIMNILDELNIPVEITESCNYKNLWYSNRMEIVGLPSIGTNGKGISEQYAMASCLGEFMERLQSSILLGYLFPQDSGDSLEVCRYDKKEFEKYFEHVCKYLTKDEQDELLSLKYKNILYGKLEIRLTYQDSGKSYLVQAADLIAGTTRRKALSNIDSDIDIIDHKLLFP